MSSASTPVPSPCAPTAVAAQRQRVGQPGGLIPGTAFARRSTSSWYCVEPGPRRVLRVRIHSALPPSAPAGIRDRRRAPAGSSESATRADQEHAGKRDLRHDQRRANPVVALSLGRSAVRVLQEVVNGGDRNPKRRSEAEDEAGQNRHHQREAECVQIERTLCSSGSTIASSRASSVCPPRREPHRAPRRSTKARRSRSASGEQPAAAGAECGADGHFLLAGRRAGQLQIREVRAHDQHHDADRAGEHHEGGAEAPADVLVEQSPALTATRRALCRVGFARSAR